MDHLERMYVLHRTLRVRRYPASTSVLMDLLECSRSTLHRTISHMRDHLGAPILNAPGRGYFYDKTAGKFELPGLWFRRSELEALLVMEHLLEGVQPGILTRYVDPLRAKVQQILDVGVTGPRSFPTNRVRILRAHARTVPEGLFVPVASALIERRQLAFAYAGRAAGTVTRRTASPQRLVYYRDQWYLDCWDEGKDALRTFSIDRMGDVEILDRAARDVGDDELDAALTGGYGLFSVPARQKARLVFTPERARWVADERWHADQVGRFREDGFYELVVPYSDPRELVGEILRHGAGVVVVEPESLAESVKEQLEAALVEYES